jgi:uncharacterized protein with NRDE domain
MCLIAVYYRMFDDAPLVLAANREEEYARGGTTIGWQHGTVPFLAGTDPSAGGTWLGINAHRLLVAVTNRRKSNLPEQPRSRGLLVKDLLALASARQAADLACRELAVNRYRGCNLLIADDDALWVVHGGDWLRVRSLAPGIHIITNADVNDPHDDRIQLISAMLHESAARNGSEALEQLQGVAGHTGPPTPICLRGEKRGTVASTLLALGSRPRRSRLLHSDGPPDQTPYADRTDLLWELESVLEGRQ